MQQFAVFPGAHRVELAEAALPKVAPDQFLLRARITGISAGTEGMWFAGTATAIRSGRKSYPYRPGYEFVGEVVTVGDQVGGLAPGDRVFTLKQHGTHALVGPADVWFKLPPELADEDALAMALCGTSIHAVHRAEPQFGATVAVVGLGALGLIMTQVLRHGPAGRVVAVTTSPRKARWAEECGADLVLAGDVTAHAAPADVAAAFECSGTNPGLDRAVAVLAPQGKLVCAGFYTEPLALSGEDLFAKELTVLGVRVRGPMVPASEFLRWNAAANMQLAFELIRGGAVRLAPWVTHRVTPAELAATYRMIAARDEPFGQIVIDWTGHG